MTTQRTTRRPATVAAILGTAALLAALFPGAVLAAPPANDDITAPTVIGGVPYADGPSSTAEATTGATDPAFCHDPALGPDAATVWYAFTPGADGRFLADTFGSDYDTTLYVGTPDAGGISVIGCNDDAQDLQSAVAWTATAGTTYLIAVGVCCGDGTVGEAGPGGSLELHLDVAPPEPAFDLTVNTSGAFAPYGAATISGTVTCSNADEAWLELMAAQRVGRFTLRGYAGVAVTCDGTTQPWSLEVTSDDGRFRGGALEVTAFGQACSPLECVFDDAQVRVRLRR
jgi:hypothetical protein